MTGEVYVQQVDQVQPWVNAMGADSKAEYDKVREENIDEYREHFIGKFGELLEKAREDGVDLDVLALTAASKLAVQMRDTFEAGIQVGKDSNRAYYEQRAREDSSFRMNAVGNWAG